jgi:hypothetical protein
VVAGAQDRSSGCCACPLARKQRHRGRVARNQRRLTRSRRSLRTRGKCPLDFTRQGDKKMTVVVRRQCRPTANGGNDQELTWACRLINLTASPAIRRTGHEGHPEKLHTNRSAWVGAAAIDAFSKASCSEPIELAQEHGNAFTHGLTAQQATTARRPATRRLLPGRHASSAWPPLIGAFAAFRGSRRPLWHGLPMRILVTAI